MGYTTFKSRTEFLGLARDAANELKNKLDPTQLAMTENGIALQKDSYHLLTRVLKPHNRVERTLYGLMFQVARQTELMAASAGYLSTVFGLGVMQELFKSSNELNDVRLLKQSSSRLIKRACELTRRPTQDDVARAVQEICGEDKDLSIAVTEAIELAGVEGHIRLEDTKQSCYVVEQTNGYTFTLKPYRFFLGEPWEALNVKVLLVDGTVENVSELDAILSRSLETQTPMVIISQGFSEEVVATLKTNYDRGVLNVIPLKVQPDLEGLNVLADLAAIVGGDVVSFLKGDLLICKEHKDIQNVDKVIINGDQVSFHNSKTRTAVGAQIRYLLEKKTQPINVEGFETLYDKRLQTLLAHTVVLRLPTMTTRESETIRTKVDVCLRTVKSLLAYGIIETKDVLLMAKEEPLLTKVIEEGMKSRTTDRSVAALTFCAAIHYAVQMMGDVMSSAGLVELETIRHRG